MSNELVKGAVTYTSLSGISVTLTPETVKNTLTRGRGNVTDQEVAMFIRTCQAKKLDPLETGEVYLIKYDNNSPAQLVVGYFAYARRADRFPDYRGFKAGITVIRKLNGKEEVIQKEGQCVYKALGETLIGGWCRVYRERSAGYVEESFVEVSLDEYSSGKNNWNTKPATMIRKVAISQALRQAFPNEYEGLYTIDEMQASGAIPAKYKVDEETGEITVASSIAEHAEDEDPIITQDERKQLFATMKELFGDNGNATLKNLLQQEGYEATTNLPRSVMQKIIDTAKDIAEHIDDSEEEEEEAQS